MCLIDWPQQGISKHMLKIRTKHKLKSPTELLLNGLIGVRSLESSVQHDPEPRLFLQNWTKQELPRDAFIVISLQVILSLLIHVLSCLTFPPPETSMCGWGGQACTRGSTSTSQQITNTGQQALQSTQSTVRSTHGMTCGHVGVRVQV